MQCGHSVHSQTGPSFCFLAETVPSFLFGRAAAHNLFIHSLFIPSHHILGCAPSIRPRARVGDRRSLHDLHEHLYLYLQNNEEESDSSSALEQSDIRKPIRKKI